MGKIMRKLFLLTATALTVTFICNASIAERQYPLHVQLANNNPERDALIYNCQIIRARICEYYAAQMGPYGGNSSGLALQIKASLTQYLQSVGTPTALHLLQEMQVNNFSGWV